MADRIAGFQLEVDEAQVAMSALPEHERIPLEQVLGATAPRWHVAVM